jgi:cyclopropane fatty-acyl-phospholipid synthase-like methyltransferase
MGGAYFTDDSQFVASAVRDISQLSERAGLTAQSRMLDWGCGAGRLAIGIKHTFGHVEDYHGVDVQRNLIDWAKANLADEHTHFSLVDASNARYNPKGSSAHTIPAADGSVDVFSAYSIFTHLLVDDTAAYLRIIAGILAPNGRAFITAFVEDEVPPWEENPEHYGSWSGPLHCVRYNRGLFEALLRSCNLLVAEFEHHMSGPQSAYVLTRRRLS